MVVERVERVIVRSVHEHKYLFWSYLFAPQN